jgi:hypothetical protein
MRVDILDLDGAAPNALPAHIRAGARYRDLRDLGRPLRLWAKQAAMEEFRCRVADDTAQGGPVVSLLGSGDYHHLASALIAGRRERLTVFHFDNHPDWMWLAPRHHCGSWVNRALELENVVRIVTIGPCSSDLERPQTKGGNLAPLRDGRLELYPWRHPPSFVWGRFGCGPSYRQKDRSLVWRNLADEDWQRFCEEIAERTPTEAIWITIDKDVLRRQDALTNWDQGEMPLAALLAAIRVLGRHRRIVGADICGDYSEPDPRHGWVKRCEMWSDHAVLPEAADPHLNATTNEALLFVLQEASA